MLGSLVVPQSNIIAFADCDKSLEAVKADLIREASSRTSQPSSGEGGGQVMLGVFGSTFANCGDARAAGFSSIRRGQPGYAAHLDIDNDGTAC